MITGPFPAGRWVATYRAEIADRRFIVTQLVAALLVNLTDDDVANREPDGHRKALVRNCVKWADEIVRQTEVPT